jgi:hypothetical protein
MKLQDFGFICIYLGLLISHKYKWLIWAGLFLLILAIPLYAKWIFFTAERFVWYAALLFTTYIIYLSVKIIRR